MTQILKNEGKSTSDIAHFEETEAQENQGINPDTLNLDDANLDTGNIDDPNTNKDDKAKVDSSIHNHSSVSLEEKKKLLWKDKIIPPNRSEFVEEIF